MQTATDYIFEQLEENSLFFRGTDNELNISISASDYLDLKRLAKEMEKQQMCDFFREGYLWCNSPSLKLDNNGEIITNTIKYGEFYYDRKFKK